MGGHLPKLDQIGRFETNSTVCQKSQTIPGGLYCSGDSTVTIMYRGAKPEKGKTTYKSLQFRFQPNDTSDLKTDTTTEFRM